MGLFECYTPKIEGLFWIAPKNIAIDSSGLKFYSQDEWVCEKYGVISEKCNWCKLNVSVDQYNIIQTSELKNRKIHDASVVDGRMKWQSDR